MKQKPAETRRNPADMSDDDVKELLRVRMLQHSRPERGLWSYLSRPLPIVLFVLAGVSVYLSIPATAHIALVITFAALFGLGGIALFCGAGFNIAANLYLLARGKVTTGEVIHYETEKDEGLVHYWPQVQFQVDGHKYKVLLNVAYNLEPAIGMQVRLRYDPADPATAQRLNFMNTIIAPTVLFIFGLFLCALSTGIALKGFR